MILNEHFFENIEQGMILIRDNRKTAGVVKRVFEDKSFEVEYLSGVVCFYPSIEDLTEKSVDFNLYNRLIDAAEPGDIIIDKYDHKLQIDDIFLNSDEEPYIVAHYDCNPNTNELHLYNEDIKGLMTKEELLNKYYVSKKFQSNKEIVKESLVLKDNTIVKVGMIGVYNNGEYISQITNIIGSDIYAKMHEDGYEYILSYPEKYCFYNKPMDLIKYGDLIIDKNDRCYEVSDTNIKLINLLKEDDIKGILTEEQLEFMMILQPTDLKKDIEFMN